MNALGVKIEQEVIPDAPTEKPAPGLYYIEMKDRTDVVDHGLVGESKKAGAYLRVDNDGKMADLQDGFRNDRRAAVCSGL